MNLQFTLDFLADLAKHNNKDWMDANKKRYQEAKDHFISLVADILQRTIAFDPTLDGLEPKKTIFRINRDIRFSKNKDPYKTNFGAFLVEGGKNSGNPGYYLHLQPGNNFVGGGIYQPDSSTLSKVRQEIDYNGPKLRKIISGKSFTDVYPAPFSDDKLKTAPKGYPKDHPDLDLLQLKHYAYMTQIQDKQVTGGSYAEQVADAFKVLLPFNQFLKEAIS